MPESDSDPEAPMTAIGTLRASRQWLRRQGPVLDSDLGELSRLGATRMALRRGTVEPRRIGGALLVDHSEQKTGGTREMFGRDLPVVNPYRCFRGMLLRLLVLVALLLPRRLQREVVAVAVAESLSRQLDESVETFLWNPYNLVGFALAARLPNLHVYVLAPEYPPVKRAVAVYSNATVLDIQRVPAAQRRPFLRQHAFVSDDLKFVFYPSQAWTLESSEFEEHKMLSLIAEIQKVSLIPLEVRLHYHDLQGPLSESLMSRIGDLIVSDERPSLHTLSSRQISFSCHSSIGYELLSLGVPHLIIGPQAGGSRSLASSEELNAWFASSKSVIPFHQVPHWNVVLGRVLAERVTTQGSELLFDGHRIAAW